MDTRTKHRIEKERTIIKEVPYEAHMSKHLLEQFLDTLPKLRKDDPDRPEWKPTPIHRLDLSPFGYDIVVLIKDESQNPTGTFKDRKSHELGPVQFRAFAEMLHARKYTQRELSNLLVPRYCEITTGNSGIAQAVMNAKYGLPPPKLVIDCLTPNAEIEFLKKFQADIYTVDLNKNIFTGGREPYTPQQIRIIANNASGHDITSSNIIDREKDYYDWHVHESFNAKPDMVFLPYGSGELFSNYITWQKITAKNNIANTDVRLNVKPEDVSKIAVFAAEPARSRDSCADKLTGIKPFVSYNDNDFQWLRQNGFTGARTGVYCVSEDKIRLAYDILTQSGIATEPSASASLALYLELYERKSVNPTEKALIINTGRGLLEDKRRVKI